MHIMFVNESSLPEATVERIATACDFQMQIDIVKAWRGDVRCLYGGNVNNVVIKPGDFILHLLDTSDQQGALGYHDEDGNEVPFGKVFVKTAQQYGQQPSGVCSHEAMELAIDEHVNLTAMTGDGMRLYAYEVADACQGNDYVPTGSPYTDMPVADFVVPSWFDPHTPATEATDFRGALKGPFTIGPQGYMDYLDLTNLKAGWQQHVGQEHVNRAPAQRRRDRVVPASR
jgi:hypothetical protein